MTASQHHNNDYPCHHCGEISLRFQRQRVEGLRVDMIYRCTQCTRYSHNPQNRVPKPDRGPLHPYHDLPLALVDAWRRLNSTPLRKSTWQ